MGGISSELSCRAAICRCASLRTHPLYRLASHIVVADQAVIDEEVVSDVCRGLASYKRGGIRRPISLTTVKEKTREAIRVSWFHCSQSLEACRPPAQTPEPLPAHGQRTVSAWLPSPTLARYASAILNHISIRRPSPSLPLLQLSLPFGLDQV